MRTQRKDRGSGGSGDLGGGRREPGGPIWPLEVPLRDAVAHRLRPVGISTQARSVTAGAGQGELLLASRAVLGRYVVMSSGVVKPARMSQR
jgi:hypothetical protein